MAFENDNDWDGIEGICAKAIRTASKFSEILINWNKSERINMYI